MIRSGETGMAAACLALEGDRRWCLTGTPVQNGLKDLYPLFRFLQVPVLCNALHWLKLIEKPFFEGNRRASPTRETVYRFDILASLAPLFLDASVALRRLPSLGPHS